MTPWEKRVVERRENHIRAKVLAETGKCVEECTHAELVDAFENTVAPHICMAVAWQIRREDKPKQMELL